MTTPDPRELEARTVCIDLDFTLCTHQGDYALAEPVPAAREALRALREAGWVIVVQTARHFNHWNADPWQLDYSGNGGELAAGTVYLLPYYLGLYHGFIEPPRR